MISGGATVRRARERVVRALFLLISGGCVRCRDAWEYAAYGFPVVDHTVSQGDPVGTPGEIRLNGVEYDNAFAKLLLDFFASGTQAFSAWDCQVLHDTDLTLLIVGHDSTQDGDGPYSTKVKFKIWNENEVGFSGLEYCITKWDQSLLSHRGSHFLVENLQTSKGRARIDGVDSVLCPGSTDQALVGVAAKVLTFYRSDGHPRGVRRKRGQAPRGSAFSAAGDGCSSEPVPFCGRLLDDRLGTEHNTVTPPSAKPAPKEGRPRNGGSASCRRRRSPRGFGRFDGNVRHAPDWEVRRHMPLAQARRALFHNRPRDRLDTCV